MQGFVRDFNRLMRKMQENMRGVLFVEFFFAGFGWAWGPKVPVGATSPNPGPTLEVH
jgi:hypothetical protein